MSTRQTVGNQSSVCHSRTAGGATITMVPFSTTKLLCSGCTTICLPPAILVYGIGPSDLLSALGPDSGVERVVAATRLGALDRNGVPGTLRSEPEGETMGDGDSGNAFGVHGRDIAMPPSRVVMGVFGGVPGVPEVVVLGKPAVTDEKSRVSRR